MAVSAPPTAPITDNNTMELRLLLLLLAAMWPHRTTLNTLKQRTVGEQGPAATLTYVVAGGGTRRILFRETTAVLHLIRNSKLAIAHLY